MVICHWYLVPQKFKKPLFLADFGVEKQFIAILTGETQSDRLQTTLNRFYGQKHV